MSICGIEKIFAISQGKQTTTKMKTLFTALVVIIAMASCKKENECVQCVRTWSVETYELTPEGGTLNHSSVDNSSTESFMICGGDNEVQSAEQPIVNETQTPILNGNVSVIKSTGICSCD